MIDKIDFVITWVDGNDPVWQKERNHYAVLENREVDNSSARYRDWDTLRYWFRGVEKFAPWVNNIFFVTCGHLPNWLNVNHPKLKIIKHSDYIPKEYLPTFNSNVIEFYFHRIPELSDRFVYFNDDTFLIDRVKPDRFFKKGLPCDLGAITSINNKGSFGSSIFNAKNIINEHFDKREMIKKEFWKWYNPLKVPYLLRNLMFYFIGGNEFCGFVNHHLPQGFLKRTYEEVWKNCEQDLIRTSKNKFRQYGDVTFWLLRYWQLASGNYIPYNVFKDGRYYYINDENILNISDCVHFQKCKLICLNDTDKTMHYEECKNEILIAFDFILSEKCSYEL